MILLLKLLFYNLLILLNLKKKITIIYYTSFSKANFNILRISQVVFNLLNLLLHIITFIISFF